MPSRPFYVSKLGGGKRTFAYLSSAVRFAHQQAVASWAQEDWTVWEHGKDDLVCAVTAQGVVYDPLSRAVPSA